MRFGVGHDKKVSMYLCFFCSTVHVYRFLDTICILSSKMCQFGVLEHRIESERPNLKVHNMGTTLTGFLQGP